MAFHLFLVDEKVESQGSVQEVIRAKRIGIVNAMGQPVVSLWDSGFLGGAVGVYDRDGTLIAKMSSSDYTLTRGGAVTVYNQDGTRVADMLASEKGGGQVNSYNKTGDLIVGIGTMGITGERGFISIYNNIGKPVATMIETENKIGAVSVSDNTGNIIAGMVGAIEGHGEVFVFNRDGKISGKLP